MKRTIEIPHEMLKDLVKIYAEKCLGLRGVETEKTVAGRKIDIVGREEEHPQVYVEVESERPSPKYIDEYYEFCVKTKPFKAYLVAPEFSKETRSWVDERYQYKRELAIIPIKDIFDELGRYFYIEWEFIDGKLTLTFSPR